MRYVQGFCMDETPTGFRSAIISEMKQNRRNPDQKLIQQSLEFSIQAHENQKRVSGEPYWIHPAHAALILAKLGADSETVAAALLHDTLEDTPTTESMLLRQFGSEVTVMVKGVTKLDRLGLRGREQQYEAANLQKMMLASSKDLRVLAIKLADKLHNLQTLQYLPKKDQVRIASQAISVFVPLAHKLGIHDLMHELEDLSFSFINPKKFGELQKKVRILRQKKTQQLGRVVQELQKKTKAKQYAFGFKNKTIFGLYAKSIRLNKPLEELYDSTILKIQTSSVQNCYCALGDLHASFFPVPNKLKDYIAIPLPNLYQALHSTMIGPDGTPFKAYIGTDKMFDLSSRGILTVGSHWNGDRTVSTKERINHLNKVFSMLRQFAETDEFMKYLTQESLSKTIFVFTPKGKLVELPYGSTPLDFAFKINPWLGERVWRAKVDGKFVGVDTKLRSGNMVEILPSKHIQVREKWLELANTISAKNAISEILKQKRFQKSRPTIDITIICKDRAGLVADTARVFQSEGISLQASYSVSENKKTGILQYNINWVAEEQLKRIMRKLRSIPDIHTVSVER